MKNRGKKRILALVMTLALALSLLPGTALAAEVTGDFTVTGGEVGIHYSYADNTLTIKSGANLTISGNTIRDKIVVESGATNVNITLSGVDIQFSDGGDDPGTCAFSISAYAEVALTLADGTFNTLKSGANRAGLEVPEGAKVTIDGSGKLTATGAGHGAGIGGSHGQTAGTIIIQGGTVAADSVLFEYSDNPAEQNWIRGNGAGIGGGNGGSGGIIAITGGTVEAASQENGAGIGGGSGSAGGKVTITGGTVTATSRSGAGIGGAQGGAGGNVTITGGTVTATSQVYGAGIGGGNKGAGGNVSIIGGTVKATGHVGVGPGLDGTGFDTYIRTVPLAAGSTDEAERNRITNFLLENDGNFTVSGAVELPCDLTIPGGKTLTIPDGATLTVPGGKTLTNDGEIKGGGTLTGDGLFGGGGTYTLKVSRTLAAPTASNIEQTSITLGTVAGKPDEMVQYAMNTANLSPTGDTWQDSPVFDGLTAGTTYYFFVRTTGSAIYADAVSPAAALTTASAPTPNPTPTPTPDRGSDDGGNSPSPAEQAASKVDKAKDGDTVEIALPSGGKLDGKILEAAAGKDVTLEINAGNGVTWIVNGKDVPTGQKLADLNLKVDAKANTIPVNVINAVTGEQKVMQLKLSHNGAFPIPLTLRLDAGKDSAGLFANLYYYNETAGKLEYQSTAKIGSDGSADIPFEHASSYAVVIDKESHAPAEPPFTDVKKGDWCYDAVAYVHQKGLMVGTTDTTFGPDGAVTRAQMWTVLARLDGQELSGSGVFEQARQWAVAQDVSDGTDPTGAVTRQQLVAMLYRYAQSTGMDVSVGEDTNILSYGDASDVAEWAVPAFQWACGAGVVSGTSESTLSPQGGATRAQLAAILQRFSSGTSE